MTTLSPTARIATQYESARRPVTRMAVSPRKLAIATGICFLITHVTSIMAPFLNGFSISNSSASAGSDSQLFVAAILEVILAMANIGTAVALFPVVRRWNEGAALGYVGLRTLEAAVIAVGVLPLLVLVTLRQSIAASLDTATATAIADMLAIFYKWTLLIGPGLVCATNTVLMAYLMYGSRLVPRFIPVLGLVGGPLIFVFTTIRIMSSYSTPQAWMGLLVLPIFAWEVSLALWLIFRGFNRTALATMTEEGSTSR